MFQSLRFKIVAVLVILNSVSFLAISLINYGTFNKRMDDQLIRHSLSSLNSTAVHLSELLSLHLKEAERISRSVPLRLQTAEERLAYLRSASPQIDLPIRQIGFASLWGSMTLANGETFRVSGIPAYDSALQGSGAYAAMMLDSTGYPVLWQMVPYYGLDNRLTGVIGFALDAPALLSGQLDAHSDDYRDSSMILIDRETNLLYYKDTSLILKRNYLTDEPAVADFAKRLQNSDQGYGESMLFGRVLKMFYVKVPNTDWYAVYSVSKQEFEAPLRRSLWLNVALIAATVLVLGLFMYGVIQRSILGRLKQVVAVTQRVAAGNFYPRPLAVESRDEMGVLADSVNGMIDNLQELFEPYQAFIRHNQYAMIVTDAHFVITSFNQRATDMLGYRPHEVVGRKSLLLWHDPAQLQERAAYYSDKLQSRVDPDESVLFLPPRKGFLPNWEWTWVSRIGLRFPVSLNTSVIRHPDGTPKGYVLIARDVSEIKQAVATNTRLFAIMDSAHDMIASFDKRGQIFYLNKAGLALLDIESLSESNRHLNKYMSIPMTVRFAEGLSEARTHGYWQDEIDFTTAKGLIQRTSITVVAHQAHDDKEIYYSTIVRDISQLKEIQSQLLSAKEEADRANEAKSSFLARMSHEIRTPLNGIIGLTHLLQRLELTELQASYLDQISVSSDNLLRLLNDILDYSKLEADKLTIENVPFEPEELLHKLSGLFAVLIGPKPVDFIIRSDSRIPDWLIGDPTRLKQILLNLGSNAIKFTNIGLIELSVTAGEVDDRSARLKFSVKDTGIGMTEDQRKRLFKPFVQADEKTSRKYGGTGLGLVISHTLVERMGGALSVASQYQVGSEFSFELSFSVCADRPSADHPQFPGLKLLVLEDENRVAEHWRVLLTSLECETVALSSWRQAQALMKESRWDAIVIDLECGDMHGEETWTAWKTELDAAGVKAIASTTLSGRDALYRLADAYRPEAVLVKPSTPLQVRQALLVITSSSPRTAGPLPSPSAEAAAALETNAAGSADVCPRIWVVDDQEINRIVIQQLLGSQGYTTFMLESGTEAVARIESGEAGVDLILMDLHMPDMDGIEATVRIRKRFGQERLPIVAVTADATPEMHARCREAGMNAIVTKPIEPVVLYACIRQWLPSLGPAPAAPAPAEAESEAGAAASWPNFPELQAAAALQRIGGKAHLYVKLLEKFVAQYADFRHRLEQLLESGETNDAIRLSHSLSGSAGHLGAAAIQEAAAALERSLRSDERVPEALERLYRSLEAGMNAIHRLLESKRS
ncbi:response regulator [Cohnella cellulosilytica]|uniref:histidine kinase n=1 Tax=Cohnella cellulosilytica TaxID=986710 RepID=A0ABW2FD43_9BACL